MLLISPPLYLIKLSIFVIWDVIFSYLLTLGSLSHVQPGSRDGLIQCFIKRDKSKLTYRLYLSLTSGMSMQLPCTSPLCS